MERIFCITLILVVASFTFDSVESVPVNASFAYVPSDYPRGYKWILMVDGNQFVGPEQSSLPVGEFRSVNETPEMAVKTVVPESNPFEGEQPMQSTERQGKQLSDTFDVQFADPADMGPMVYQPNLSNDVPQETKPNDFSYNTMPQGVPQEPVSDNFPQETLPENVSPKVDDHSMFEQTMMDKVPLDMQNENSHFQTSPMVSLNAEIQQFPASTPDTKTSVDTGSGNEQVNVSFRSGNMENLSKPMEPMYSDDTPVNVQPMMVANQNGDEHVITKISSNIEYRSKPGNMMQYSMGHKMSPTPLDSSPGYEGPTLQDIEMALKQLSKIVKPYSALTPGSAIYVQGPAIINQLRKKKNI